MLYRTWSSLDCTMKGSIVIFAFTLLIYTSVLVKKHWELGLKIYWSTQIKGKQISFNVNIVKTSHPNFTDPNMTSWNVWFSLNKSPGLHPQIFCSYYFTTIYDEERQKILSFWRLESEKIGIVSPYLLKEWLKIWTNNQNGCQLFSSCFTHSLVDALLQLFGNFNTIV